VTSELDTTRSSLSQYLVGVARDVTGWK